MLRALSISLCAAAFLLAWLPRLRFGFWTDEAGTFWMASEGWWAAIARSWSFPGQSVLYGVLQSFFVWKGPWEEPLLRIPSVLAMLVAAWQLKKLAERLIAPDAGWLSLVPFFCSPEVAIFGTSARPYPLAMAASLASFRYLLQWQEDASPRTIVKYLVASVLTVYFHYLFGFVFVIQAVYLAYCVLTGRKVRLGLPLIAALVLPLSLLPLLSQLRFTAHLSNAFADAAKPTLTQLIQLSLPPALLLGTALGAILLLILQRGFTWRNSPPCPQWIVLGAAWMFLGPIVFFAANRLTGLSVFATRYLLFTLPAVLLAIAWLISGVRNPAHRNFLLVAIFMATALHPSSLLTAFRPSPSSWREPLTFVARHAAPPAPVFITSGLADSSWLNWKTENPRTSPLYSPMSAYPVPNRAIGLPYQFGPQVQEFIGQIDFSPYQSLFLVAAQDSPVGTWMSSHLEQRGFRADVHPLNDYVVIEYRRP